MGGPGGPAPLAAQEEALVEPLAGVLAAEDARRFNRPLLQAAARHDSPIVRARTALALGRIGARDALDILNELSFDPDSSVQREALFALGLIGDPAALGRLRDFLLAERPDGPRFDEAVGAMARIGGRQAARYLADLLSRWAAQGATVRLPSAVVRTLQEAWRLGEDAPVRSVLQFSESTDPRVRRAVVYTLGRLRAPSAIPVMLRASEDRDDLVRSYAARALTAEYADSAGVSRAAVESRLERLAIDRDRRVRINALRSIGSFGEEVRVSLVADRTADPDPNVRVQALEALGRLPPSPPVTEALTLQLNGGLYATRRLALLGLAHAAPEEALVEARRWAGDPEWTRRAVAAEALGRIGTGGVADLIRLTGDEDARVIGAALAALWSVPGAPADSVARVLAAHPDPRVRAEALGRLARRPVGDDITLFVGAYRRAARDPNPMVRIAVVRGLGRLAGEDPGFRETIERRFLGTFDESADYRVRQAAERDFPLASQRWGPARPLETGRGIEDYRDIVRTLFLPARLRGIRPRIVVETDRGNLVIDLLADVAPLTVNAILELIDRRYYDAGRWHRVVPNFVIQGGEPAGDGRGDPGFSLRDEVSREGYDTGTVGLARYPEPDSGGSQFFITLSPQPHLNGSYTVFGRLRDGGDILNRITEGERIRRVRRRQ